MIWENKNFHCQARQLSEYGMLLVPEHKELIREDVQIKFELDSPHHSLSLSGIIAYAIDDGTGVRFKSMSTMQKTILREYVQARYADAANPAV
jgi:hypothetical protein